MGRSSGIRMNWLWYLMMPWFVACQGSHLLGRIIEWPISDVC